jgi:hypothetical protein
MSLEYKILEAGRTIDLEQLVNQAIVDGWMLQGGVCCAVEARGDATYSQAVIREKS